MKESVIDINLTKSPPARNCKGDDNANNGRFQFKLQNNWAESVTIVDSMLLSEAACHQACLVFVDRAIRMIFGLEDPLATDKINTRRPRHKRQSTSLE
jgi:hypothetical protein